MSDVKQRVDAKITSKKVMVFSKSSCPYCKKAKRVFEKYMRGKILKSEDYGVMELENDSDMVAIQEYLRTKTGARSVPRVFINRKFVGGGDDIVALDSAKKLVPLLIA